MDMALPDPSARDRVALAACGLHPDRRRRLVEQWGTPGAVLRGLRRGQIEVSPAIRSAAERDPDEVVERLAALDARILLRGAAGFPEQLAALPDAPDLLFVRGVLPDTAAVAVVGTRRCTRYGRGLAESIGRAVAAAGWPLVSGLARGIDGAAHAGTVAGRGQGVAVLGSGIDVWYPPEHRPLAQRLLDLGGAVATEYPPGSPPEGWRFPPRNRIIAGLAAAVIVVEAHRKGGALITAAAGLDQGRAVFAVPGDVDREASTGCNLLIRDGAHPVLGPDDAAEALSLVLGPPREEATVGREAPADPLVSLIPTSGRSVESLARAAAAPVRELLARLAVLEAAGTVRREGGVVMRC